MRRCFARSNAADSSEAVLLIRQNQCGRPATGQVDFGELPAHLTKRLSRRVLPVAVLAWLGVDRGHQGRGLGCLLLAQALRDCWDAGKTFAFVAVILDCLTDAAKAFYRHWDFEELPGRPCRLFLSAKRLAAMMEEV